MKKTGNKTNINTNTKTGNIKGSHMKKAGLFLLAMTLTVTGQEIEVGVEVEEEVGVQKVIEHAGLTREEIFLTRTQQDYYVVNDIITKKTIFIDMNKTMEYFMKSLSYYNRPLAAVTKKALLKSRKDKKRYYVSIVGGGDTPEHSFGARNNVYKVDEYTNGQYTIFYVEPDGRIFQDHYQSGDYGQLGRDGVSFEHSVKTFGAVDIKKAVNRATKSDKDFNWQVTLKFPDMRPEIIVFDTFMQYEEWFNRERIPEKYTKLKKIPVDLDFPKIELSNKE